MQDLSYNSRDPLFSFAGIDFSNQIFTFENVYGMDVEKCEIKEDDNEFIINCSGFTWAGGQEKIDGNAVIQVIKEQNSIKFNISASFSKKIRCAKLTVKNIVPGCVVNLRDCSSLSIPEQGLLYKYPEGWRHTSTPMIVLQQDNSCFQYFRSLDNKVREKRFALLPQGNMLDIELIFEEDATMMGNSISVPSWEIGFCNSVDDIYQKHTKHIEKSYNLTEWDERKDVPQWAKNISLVASIHCQHWTGHIFNDYKNVLEKIKWLSSKIDPQRILVYLPGWEGRYYWKYGNYCPDERMGGEKGFENLVRSAKEIGVHMMPMFGINIVNREIENFEQWGAPCEMISTGGYKDSGSVDWDSSRHFDHGWGASLNPGAPGWQNRLSEQINSLIERYGFDAVFLDISALWKNDPCYSLYDGIKQFVSKIKIINPDILIAGEGWYDAISAITPLVQSGHTNGLANWHDVPYPELFDKYARSFGHLCLGDPGRGSTGVHELGYNKERRVPLRKGIIPTITIVDDTFNKGEKEVVSIIEDARKYAELFIEK